MQTKDATSTSTTLCVNDFAVHFDMKAQKLISAVGTVNQKLQFIYAKTFSAHLKHEISIYLIIRTHPITRLASSCFHPTSDPFPTRWRTHYVLINFTNSCMKCDQESCFLFAFWKQVFSTDACKQNKLWKYKIISYNSKS